MYQSKMAVAIKVAGTTSHENKAPRSFLQSGWNIFTDHVRPREASD